MSIATRAVPAGLDSFAGELLLPGDAGYEQVRRVHNGLIDKRPSLIARCLTTPDVADAVRYARVTGLEIAVRGGGHNVAGNAVTEGGLMIDLSAMKGVHVDPTARTIWAQGGVLWRELNRAAHAHGLATTGGVVSSTGIAGLTLGGGEGWLMGRYGMTVDNVLAVELVTADGDMLAVDDQHHPDLFWALRGGGGNFGVATAFEYRAHHVGTVLGGMVLHTLDPGGRRLVVLPGVQRRGAGRAHRVLRARSRPRRVGDEADRHAPVPLRARLGPG